MIITVSLGGDCCGLGVWCVTMLALPQIGKIADVLVRQEFKDGDHIIRQGMWYSSVLQQILLSALC